MAPKFQRILYPTDFSELALIALDHAITLAESFKGELFCLHVVDDAFQYWNAVGLEGIPVGPPSEELIELGRARMEKFRLEYLAKVTRPVTVQVAMGRPFAEIIGTAREQSIDVIVMGTHGRGAIAHMLLGSTTEKVVRKAPCAVLTVRPDNHTFVMP